MTDEQDDLGDLVRARRRALGWTIARLHRESSLSRGTITEIEAGKRHNLSPSTVLKLEQALGIELDRLSRPRPRPGPVPRPSSPRAGMIWLDPDLYARLAAAADERDVPVEWLANRAVARFLGQLIPIADLDLPGADPG